MPGVELLSSPAVNMPADEGIPPPEPLGAQLRDPRGNMWPCGLLYEGVQDGVHMWLAVPLDKNMPPVADRWQLRVAYLPAHTGIRLEVPHRTP
jgi:hypothetical protein